MYSLQAFLAVLEALLQTAHQSYQQTEGTAGGPSLAEVLVGRYSLQYRLALVVDTENWFLTDETSSPYDYCLIIDVPVLIERHFRFITEDWLPPARAVDIAALRVQMQGEVRVAYRKKYGVAG
jgi:hypothetical protein